MLTKDYHEKISVKIKKTFGQKRKSGYIHRKRHRTVHGKCDSFPVGKPYMIPYVHIEKEFFRDKINS